MRRRTLLAVSVFFGLSFTYWTESGSLASPTVLDPQFAVEPFVTLPSPVDGISALAFGEGGIWGNDLYVLADAGNTERVYRVNASGNVVWESLDYNNPAFWIDGLAVRGPANGAYPDGIYLGHGENPTLRVDAAGHWSEFSSAPGALAPLEFDPGSSYGGALYLGTHNGVVKLFPDGSSSNFSGVPGNMDGIVFGPGGPNPWGDSMYAVSGNTSLYQIDPTGYSTALVDLSGATPGLGSLAIDEVGLFGQNLYLIDNAQKIWAVSSDLSYSTFGQGFQSASDSLAFGPDGFLYGLDSAGGSTVYRIIPEPATVLLLLFGGAVAMRRRY